MSPNRFRGSADGPADQPDDSASGPLAHPSQLAQADPEQLSALTRDQDASREALQAVAADPQAQPQDRVAAAVLLDAVLADPSASEALDPETAGSAEALALRFSPQLRSAAARAMGEQATMQLLTWAANSSPGAPPVEAAEAAAHLGVDDDGRIYRRVSQRAVQISEQKGLSRALKDRLRRLTDALGIADQQARRTRSDRDAAASQGTATAQGTAAGTSQDADDAPPAASAPSETTKSPESADAPDSADGAQLGNGDQHGEGTQDSGPTTAWTAGDDAALASMLGREAPDSNSDTGTDPSAGAETQERPADPDQKAADPDQPAADPRSPRQDQAPQAPEFGRPVGFDSGPSEGVGGAAGTAEPTGQWPPPPRDREIDGRPGTGPGYGSTGTTGAEAPRSYDFRYLGDDTKKPSSEAEKAEFRTTLRNWGLFALALVLVMIIVAFVL